MESTYLGASGPYEQALKPNAGGAATSGTDIAPIGSSAEGGDYGQPGGAGGVCSAGGSGSAANANGSAVGAGGNGSKGRAVLTWSY
jgi:hypothetical protein